MGGAVSQVFMHTPWSINSCYLYLTVALDNLNDFLQFVYHFTLKNVTFVHSEIADITLNDPKRH